MDNHPGSFNRFDVCWPALFQEQEQQIGQGMDSNSLYFQVSGCFYTGIPIVIALHQDEKKSCRKAYRSFWN